MVYIIARAVLLYKIEVLKMEYKFTQEVSKEDYMAFYKYHVTKNFMSPIKMLFVLIFLGVMLSGVFFGRASMTYAGIGFVIVLAVMYLRLTKSGEKVYDKNPDGFTYHFVIDEETVSFSTADGKSSKKWNEFAKFYEDEQHIFLFTKQNKGLMFVKNQIEDEVCVFLSKTIKENLKSKINIPFSKNK